MRINSDFSLVGMLVNFVPRMDLGSGLSVSELPGLRESSNCVDRHIVCIIV